MKTAAEIKTSGCEKAAWICMAVALFLIIKLSLLLAVLTGFLVFELVGALAPRLKFTRLVGRRARLAAVFILSLLVAFTLIAAIWGLLIFFSRESGNMPALMNKMAEIISDYRSGLPDWLASYLPADAEHLKGAAAEWLKAHARELQSAGKEAGLAAAHILIGMIIGIMLSLKSAASDHAYKPLAKALMGRIDLFGEAFRAIVFAQARISAINTVFTAVYLGAVLPALGINLPFVKIMIAITFIAGLIPVLGNIISNTIITVVSLSFSPTAAVASIIFLVVIHKLEYFLNARIIGGRINAQAWELLVAMFVMEAAFGMEGVIAAPIYYAYIKSELVGRGLI
jgi:predicted PurR-regulated permease PerM